LRCEVPKCLSSAVIWKADTLFVHHDMAHAFCNSISEPYYCRVSCDGTIPYMSRYACGVGSFKSIKVFKKSMIDDGVKSQKWTPSRLYVPIGRELGSHFTTCPLYLPRPPRRMPPPRPPCLLARPTPWPCAPESCSLACTASSRSLAMARG
jgi:hypothetical protein